MENEMNLMNKMNKKRKQTCMKKKNNEIYVTILFWNSLLYLISRQKRTIKKIMKTDKIQAKKFSPAHLSHHICIAIDKTITRLIQ